MYVPVYTKIMHLKKKFAREHHTNIFFLSSFSFTNSSLSTVAIADFLPCMVRSSLHGCIETPSSTTQTQTQKKTTEKKKFYRRSL